MSMIFLRSLRGKGINVLLEFLLAVVQYVTSLFLKHGEKHNTRHNIFDLKTKQSYTQMHQHSHEHTHWDKERTY